MEINKIFDDFIKTIRPERAEKDAYNKVLIEIENQIKTNDKLTSCGIFVTGLLKKETMLKYKPEAEIVVQMHRKGFVYKNMFTELDQALRPKYPNLSVERNLIRLNIVPPEVSYNMMVTILPCFKLNSPKQMQEVKRKDYYKNASAVFYLQYLNKQRPRYGRYFNVILLLKHWKRKTHLTLPDIILEIVASEFLGTTEYTSWESCFTGVVKQLHDALHGKEIGLVNWEQKFNIEIASLPKTDDGLLIADPANPTNNIARIINKTKLEQFRKAATEALELANKKDWNKLLSTDVFP